MKNVAFNMNCANVNLAVKCIKDIADNSRCISCDQLKGLHVRYPCGHSACGNCVTTAEDCLLCLSPPDVSTYVSDDPLSLRVYHASNLLNTFQDLFKLDVYRRQRISDQLKVEKQLFPECIQAPSKYGNNRRSFNTSLKNKENIQHTHLPGINTSLSNALNMENKMNYVQQWLNKNDSSQTESNFNIPRKPFTDLNVNDQNITKPKTSYKTTKRNNVSKRNRTHFKMFGSDVKEKSKLSLKRYRKDIEINLNNETVHNQIKCAKYKSGIVMEDDIISITDSQSNDKDKLACLAVIEADKKVHCDITDSKFDQNECQEVITRYDIDKSYQDQRVGQSAMCKIPFYRRSSLVNNKCNECASKNKATVNSNETKNVIITIDSSQFITIKLLNCAQDNFKARTNHSIEVQTEEEMDLDFDSNSYSKDCLESKLSCNEIKNCHNNKFPSSTSNNVKENVDLLKDVLMTDSKKHIHQSVQRPKCLIIDDSDTDSESFIENNSLLEVTADVHRSESEIDSSILCQLEPREYEHRTHNVVRGQTPASTDSSDKENYDPNRAKRKKLDKKCVRKKY